MNDMTGAALQPGDIVTDARGLLLRIEETAGSFLAQGLAAATPVHYSGKGLRESGRPATYARLYLVVKLEPKAQAEAAAEWKAAYDNVKRSRDRYEVGQHKQRVAATTMFGKRK